LQRKGKDPKVRKSMGAKLAKLFTRRYFVYGIIWSLTLFFSVPKGETDIRMVCNGTLSGMNAYFWAPWFALSTIFALLRELEVGAYIADSEIGEMFLKLCWKKDAPPAWPELT
jgi:hypothetical protein